MRRIRRFDVAGPPELPNSVDAWVNILLWQIIQLPGLVARLATLGFGRSLRPLVGFGGGNDDAHSHTGLLLWAQELRHARAALPCLSAGGQALAVLYARNEVGPNL